MKRQRSRNRNGGGGGGGGGGKPQHNTNRAFDSNGPEGVKVRGAAQGVYEKYQQLARDAQTSGDRVLAENYLQHAEHYFRLMRAMQPQRPIAEIIGRDQFVSGYDIDFEDESGAVADAGEAETESEAPEATDAGGDRQPQRFEPRREDYRNLESRGRDDQPRSDRPSGERAGAGDRSTIDRPQGERPPRDDRQRSPREDRPRDDRPRDDRPRFQRDDRPARGERVERGERNDRDPLGVVEPEATPLTALSVDSTPVAEGPMLRADDGEISHAPAFLQVRAVEAGDEPKRPRRRRASAAPTAAPSEAPASEAEE
jgi:hypothetical protein